MAVAIRGQRCWLWRALDNEGEVLDFVVQRNRDAKVAAKLIKRSRSSSSGTRDGLP
jgi:putative transposase